MKKQKIYYKVLDENMCGPYTGFRCELNKTYSIYDDESDGDFNACENMHELILLTNDMQLKECKFFKCHLGDVTTMYNYVITDSITLMEEIPFEVVDKEIRNNIGLLTNDKDPIVRTVVAEQGYGLDQLIGDDDPIVRAAVARQGYKLDQLIDDESMIVRVAVAMQGYGLNKLINDKDPRVSNTAKIKIKERRCNC